MRSVVFLSIMTSTSQELYQRANIAFLHLSLSRTIIIFANIIDICHPSQHFQMHFEKIICEASKSRVIFYFFVFILSMDHIDYGYFYNHMLLWSNNVCRVSIDWKYIYLCYVISSLRFVRRPSRHLAISMYWAG